MPRPRKPRHVGFIPDAIFLKPAGVPMRGLEVVTLALEEVEALRLKDKEELDQEECAARMRVSRPTFQRILVSARQKVATALTEGKAIRVSVSEHLRDAESENEENPIHETQEGFCPRCDPPGRGRRCR